MEYAITAPSKNLNFIAKIQSKIRITQLTFNPVKIVYKIICLNAVQLLTAAQISRSPPIFMSEALINILIFSL